LIQNEHNQVKLSQTGKIDFDGDNSVKIPSVEQLKANVVKWRRQYIVDEIDFAAKNALPSVYFSSDFIADDIRNELVLLGYKVESKDINDVCRGYVISWNFG